MYARHIQHQGARRQNLIGAFAIAATLLVAGCSNPADNVTEASVNEAQDVAMEPVAGAREYRIQPESKIEFVGSKVTRSHDGGFRTFSGKLMVADEKLVAPGSRIEIDMNSIWTDTDRLTGHLKSPDFFDVQNFPKSVFTATSIEKTGDAYTVTGNLDLHGVIKQISFPADVQVSDDQVTLKAEFFIKRFDFKVKYPGKPDDLIRDEVVIRLDVTARPGAA